MLDAEAVLRFKGEDKGLIDTLTSMSKKLKNVKVESGNTIDSFDQLSKKQPSYKKSFDAIGESASSTSKSLEDFTKAGKSTDGAMQSIAGGIKKLPEGFKSASSGVGEFADNVYDTAESAAELGGDVLPGLFKVLTTAGTVVFPDFMENLQSTQGRIELLGQATQKLNDDKNELLTTFAGLALQVTKYIKISQQIVSVDTFIQNSKLRWNELNRATSTFQGLGLDATIIELGVALAHTRINFFMAAESAQKFFDVSVQGFAKLQDKLAFNTTLSAGATAGIENMGRAMQDLVNGPLQNQVTSLDATNALYNAMSAGLTELGEAQKFLSAGLKLSGATGADSAQSIELLAKVQQAYGLTAGQAAETAAKLNGVVENGITTFPRLTGGLARTAGVAKQSGIELDELLGSIAALTKTMSSDDAMTGYSSLLQSIAGQGEQSSQAIASLGIQFDVNSIKSKGLIASLNELYTAAGGSTEKLKRIIPDALAFSTALSLMTTAAEDASDVTERIGTTGAESLDELFGNRRQSLVQQMTALTNGFNEVLIDFGERLAPVIQPAVDMLQRMLEQVQNFPEPLKQFIAGVVVAGFAVNKTKDVFGGFVDTIVNMTKAYMSYRALNLLFRGQLLKEIAAVKELAFEHGNLAGAILRVFGVKDGLAKRIQDVTGLSELQVRANVKAADSQKKVNQLYERFLNLKVSGTKIKDAAEDLRGKAQKGVKVASEVAQKGVEAAPGVAQEAARVASEVAQKGSKAVSEVAQEAAKAVPEIARKGSEVASQVAQEGARVSSEVAQQAAKAASEIAEKGVKAASEVARKGTQVASEVAQEAAKAAPEIAKEGAKVASDVTQRAAKATSEMAQDAAKAAVDVANKGSDAVSEAARRRLQQTVTVQAEAIQDAVAISPGRMQKMLAPAADTVNALSEKAITVQSQAIERAGESASSAIQVLSGQTSELSRNFGDAERAAKGLDLIGQNVHQTIAVQAETIRDTKRAATDAVKVLSGQTITVQAETIRDTGEAASHAITSLTGETTQLTKTFGDAEKASKSLEVVGQSVQKTIAVQAEVVRDTGRATTDTMKALTGQTITVQAETIREVGETTSGAIEVLTGKTSQLTRTFGDAEKASQGLAIVGQNAQRAVTVQAETIQNAGRATADTMKALSGQTITVQAETIQETGRAAAGTVKALTGEATQLTRTFGDAERAAKGLEVVGQSVQQTVALQAEAMRGAGKTASDTIKALPGQTITVQAETIRETGEAASDTIKALSGETTQLTRSFSDAERGVKRLEAVGQGIQQTVTVQAETIQDAGKTTEGGIRSIAEASKEKLEASKAAAKAALDNARSATKDAADRLKGAGRQVQEAMHVAGDAAQKGVERVTRVSEERLKGVMGVSGAATQNMQSVTENAAKGLEAVGEKVQKTIQVTAETAGKGFEHVAKAAGVQTGVTSDVAVRNAESATDAFREMAETLSTKDFNKVLSRSQKAFAKQMKKMAAPAADTIKALTGETIKLGKSLEEAERAATKLTEIGKKIAVLPDSEVKTQALQEMKGLEAALEERRVLILENETKLGIARVRQAETYAAKILETEKNNLKNIATFREKIQGAENLSVNEKRDLTKQATELERQARARLLDVQAQQESLAVAVKSNSVTQMNTAAKASNAKMTQIASAAETSRGKKVRLLDALMNKLTGATTLNTLGKKKNTATTLTLAQANQVAASAINQLTLAQAKNTIAQTKQNIVEAASIKGKALMASSTKAGTVGMNLARGAVQALTIGFKKLLITLLPFAKILLPLAAAFVVLQDFVPVLGGMAKKMKEFADSAKEADEKIAALNDNLATTAQTQREVVIQQDDFNSNLARMYNFLGQIGTLATRFFDGIFGLVDGLTNRFAKMFPAARGLVNLLNLDYGSKAKDAEKQLQSLQEELGRATNPEQVARLNAEILETEQILKNNVTLTQRWQRFIAGNAKVIDDALQGGRLEEQDRRMRLMDDSFQQSINMRENLAQGLAATEDARAIEAQVIAEQRVLTAEELKRVTELETEAIKDRIAANELHIGVAEDALKIEKDPQRQEILRQRISDLQAEGGALNEAARAMEKYRQNLATLRNRILDNDAATGSERTLERISNLRNEMVTAFEESDVGEEGRAAAEEMFDQFTEGINTASLSQRRAAVKLTGTLKTYLENATRTGVGELDPTALAANIERYYEAINEAAASGAIDSSQKNEMLQALMDQTMNIQGLEGNIMPPELLQQIEQELIDGIKAMSEKRITEKQHEIGAIQDLELQGALGPIEAIEQRAALEDQILEDRLQAQRETTAEIGRLRDKDSTEYKASLRELETLERNTRRQRVENERSIAKQVTDYNISLKQHEIGEIKSLEMQGALAPVEAAEEQLRLEREILDQRLEGQREVLAALEEMVEVDSEEYKKALRELEVLERTSVEQRINGQKRLFEARMQEVQHETKIVMDALQLSETELNTQVRQLLNDGAISAVEADEMRLSSAKERNRQELENTRQMIQHIKAELAALIEAEGDTDSPLQRQLEGQLRGAIQSQAQLALNAAELEAKANDIVAKKIEERGEIAQQAIERQVMGIQQEVDAYNQQIRLLENRNKLLSAAAQLQQSRNALENFGLESELQMLDTAIGLQSRLRDLRDQPEYHDRVLQLLDRIEEGGQNELEMLEKKQKKEMQLAEQKHKHLLAQQAIERQQLELQLQMEEVRARSAIQEAEIAVLKGVQAKLAAETAVAAAIERGDQAAERRARLQVDIARRSAALAEQQVRNAQENLGITREMAGSQEESLRTQQQLAREQSEEQLEQLAIQHEIQRVEAEVNAARRDRQAQEDARQASQAQLDVAIEVLSTIEKQNRLLEIQREAATTLRDVQKEALGMLAQLESNPYRRRKAEQEMARVRLDGLRQAQEMERRQLEMTLRREELELRIAAIKNQAAQTQSQVEVGRAQQQLQSARQSGSQAEVAAAEANLELAMAQGMATAMEGLGIEEQLSVLRESADMQREQLDYQQQMQRFQVRQENLSSLRPGQQRHQERLLRDDVRQFTRRIRQPVRNARDNVRALSESDTRAGQMDAVLASLRGGGGLDALMGHSAELFNRRQSPPSPRIQRPSGMQSSRQRQEQERTKVENVSLNNTIEINLPPGQDSPQETAERLKQAVLNTMYDVTVEMRR